MIETILSSLIIYILFIYRYINKSDVVYADTFDNGSKYLFRNIKTRINASNMLHRIKLKLIKLIDLILKEKNIKNHKFYNYLKKIKLKMRTVIIRESSPKSIYTSYSVNKGDELVFCIRSKINQGIHDINNLLYVAIHEIAHIGCPEIGHTKLFKEINLYLLEKGVEYNIYKYKNYYENPIEYCGMDITSTILKKN